jgi:anti-sigma factor RsiW
MTCPEAQSLLEDYLDKELPETTATAVAEHLKECARCRSELEASQRINQLLKEIRSPEPDPDYWDEVQSLILARTVERDSPISVLSENERRNRARASLYQSLLAVAASLIIFFAALMAGSVEAPARAEAPDQSEGILTKASLVAMACEETDSEACQAEQARLERGMLLMGRPGLLGGSTELAGTLGIK